MCYALKKSVNRSFLSFKQFYLKRTHVFLHITLLVTSVAFIYWPVYKFDFLIGWDDQWFVTNHYTQNGFTLDNLFEIATEYYYGQYAPLNQIYYTFLYSMFGYNTACFHIVGVLIHLGNTILIYTFLNIILKKLINRPKKQIQHSCFFTALLFAVHPLNIEATAWVAASKVTLYAFFYLLSLICYCKYLETFKSRYFYLTLLTFILSFGAKEQAIILPLCLFLIDYAYSRDIQNRMIWFEKLPFFILCILFGIITIYSQEIEYSSMVFYPAYQRIPLAFYSLSEYFTKSLIPVNISYLYPFPFQKGEQPPWWLWIYVFAIPLIVYCFYNLIKVKWLMFCLLFFLIHIILVVNIVSLARFSVIADRYTYLSTIGTSCIISLLFIKSFYRLNFNKYLLLASMLYIGILITYSRIHVVTWTNAFTLKEKLKTTIEQRNDFDELKKWR